MNPVIICLIGIGTSILVGGVFRILNIESFSSLFQTLAAVSAAIIAYLGLNKGVSEWRHQYRDKSNSELAKKCLVALYKLRDEIQYVRNPFISVAEMEKALKEYGHDTDKLEDNEVTNRSVYRMRWRGITAAKSELEANLLEAEAEWGKDAKVKIFKIQEQVNKLFSEIMMFLDYRSDGLHTDDILYDTGDKNEFSQDITKSISEAENYLRSKLIKD